MKDFDLLQMSAEQAVAGLLSRGETVALAESCTGGLLAKTLTDIPGASTVFECGVVAYSEHIKTTVLGVSAETLAEHSVVSPEVAVEMARGVRALAGATYGIGITGVAGPGPDGPHPEGEIYIALTDGATDRMRALRTGTAGARAENRRQAALAALELLLDGVAHGKNSH